MVSKKKVGLFFVTLFVLFVGFRLGISQTKYKGLVSWAYLERGSTYPREKEVTSSQWYQPKETVAGGGDFILKTAHEKDLKISSQALKEVEKYAGDHNSSALLVVHEGKVVLEKYWEPFTSSSFCNAFSMTKTIVGLLIGIAIDEGRIHLWIHPLVRQSLRARCTEA